MNDSRSNPQDALLAEHLRSARPAPALPPRFQEQVWRRIELPARAEPATAWLERLAQLILQPRLAAAAVAGLVLAGALLGAQSGTGFTREAAQGRYLAAVAPSILH